jgi:hypothetical protein
MSTVPFDTHAFYKAVTKIKLAKIEELATKRDIAEMKVDLQRWTVTVVLGTAILQTAIIASLILKLTARI